MNVRIALALLVCAVSALAQTPNAPTPAPAVTGYQYLLTGGVAYNATSKKPAAITDLSIRLADNTYSYTSTDIGTALGNSTAAIRTGVLYQFFQRGGLTVFSCAQGGVVTNGQNNLATFAECGAIVYDIGTKLKKAPFFVVVKAMQSQVAGVQDKPVYSISFGKAF